MDRRTTLRNRFGYGIGTLGRDLVYTMFSLYLLFFFSDVLEVSATVLTGVTVVLVITRVFDAVNDPFMGLIVDNTRSRFGRFKPWIVGGILLSAAFTLIMFSDYASALDDAAVIAVFAAVFIAWEISYTINDIAYWSMLPALSQDQKERERIGAFARICASIGAFSMVVGIVPLSNAIGAAIGDMRQSYFYVALGAVVIMLVFQLLMVVLVKEDPSIPVTTERTRLRELFAVIFRNDQLLAVTVALALFMIAYTTTVSFGIYYFKYVYGDENFYGVFAIVLGLAQLSSLTLYPWFSRMLRRATLYTVAMVLVVVGYAVFFLAPPGVIAMIVVGGIAIFAGQAAIQLLMLMFIADSVEYGQWKTGRRNDSITVSLQPFIYKLGSAIAAGIVGWTVIASGMHEAEGAAEMTEDGILLVKLAMLVVPLVLIVASWLVHRRFYRIDEERYALIVAELKTRAEAVRD